ncbi:MAG: hypothetical protein FWC92_00090 [Defluviitaleaceae bacterium]|nr:hypothetical protein [Defluviitaleaceae bacterium]
MKKTILFIITIFLILALSSCIAKASSPDPTMVLERIAGHWVDNAIYDSLIINSSLLWPLERFFHPQGVMMQAHAWPLSSFIIGGTGSPGFVYPINMRNLDNGLVELTVDTQGSVYCVLKLFYYDPAIPGYCYCQTPGRNGWDLSIFNDHRIIVDTTGPTIDKITYYIGDKAYTLVRFHYESNISRYNYESLIDSVRIRYFAGIHAFPRMFEEIWIYRSTQEGYKGERIITHIVQGWDDSIFYEFYDTTIEHGKTYFYSIWPSYEWTHQEEPLQFGDRWQINITHIINS